MATQPQRRRRLELPAPPSSSDPKAIQRYLADMRRLTMDEFNRLSGDFFDFRADVIASATIPLASVAAISVDAGQYQATFTWENPVQPQGVPTHVRVRIAEFGDTWQEYTYPLTTWTAFGLQPDTGYTFQIQLVRRESATVSFVSALRNCPSLPVQVESLSEIRSRSFVTDPGIGVPTPDDDGDPIIPIPDTDDPGPVGGTDCWWEWQIQVVNLVTGEWDDTIYGGFVAGDAGSIDLTDIMPLLDPLRLYRVKMREICNGVPGPWEYGPPWTGGGDWADDCGGLDMSSSILTSPFDTADLWAIPYFCFVAGEGYFIREFLSGVEIVPGMGYKVGYADAEGENLIFAKTWSDSPVGRLLGSTVLASLMALDNSDDFSIYFELKFPAFSVPPPGGFATENIINIGDGRIMFNVTWNAFGNWGIQFVAAREIGGTITLNSPLTYTGGVEEWTSIFVGVDQDGDKVLVIDGFVVATDSTAEEIRLDGMSGLMHMNAISEMRIRKFYGWAELITELTQPDPLVFDTFDRPNGALGTSTSGHEWQNASLWAVTDNEAQQINNAPANFGDLGIPVYIDSGVVACDIRLEITQEQSGVAIGAGILFRYAGIANYFFFNLGRNGDGSMVWVLQKRIAASFITIDIGTVTEITGSLRVVDDGSTIRAYVNDVLVTEATGETEFNTITRQGMWMIYVQFFGAHSGTEWRYDNYYVYPLE